MFLKRVWPPHEVLNATRLSSWIGVENGHLEPIKSGANTLSGEAKNVGFEYELGKRRQQKYGLDIVPSFEELCLNPNLETKLMEVGHMSRPKILCHGLPNFVLKLSFSNTCRLHTKPNYWMTMEWLVARFPAMNSSLFST